MEDLQGFNYLEGLKFRKYFKEKIEGANYISLFKNYEDNLY
jgi:hypothetical protein